MAARFKTRSYTFINTNAISLQSILNYPQDNYISSVAVRAGKTNVGIVYWRDGLTGDDGGHLSTDEAITIDVAGKFIPTGDLWFRGAQDDKIELTVLG